MAALGKKQRDIWKGMSSPSDLGVVPVRDEDGNVVSYTVGSRSAPENADAGGSGWVTSSRSFDDGTVAEPTALVALKAYTRARVKSRRRLAEEDGVIVGGIVYDTSDDAHLRLMTLLVFSSRDPDYTASILIRDGSVRQLTSPEIYNVATAIANHMQACALWEIAQLQAINAATTAEDLVTLESTIDDSAPSGDVTEPTAPTGTQPPPAFEDATFKHTTCDSVDVYDYVNVGGALAVTGDSAFTGTVTTTGATSLESTLAVAGNSTLTGTLDVAAAATIQGTLAVTDATTLTGEVTIVSPATLQATLSVGGNATVTGTFTNVDATTLQSTLRVDGSTTMVGELEAQAAATLQSTLSVGGDSTLSGTLTTVGNTELQSALTVTGESTFNANVGVNANVNVVGSLDVTEDAVVERLYARDRLAIGTMSVNATVRARTEQWLVAGSFWWRRGDRQPTGASVSFTITSNQAKPAVAFYEIGRQQVIGYTVVPASGDTLATLTIQDTLFTKNDNSAFQIDVYISNATEVGVVTLSNYLITVA